MMRERCYTLSASCPDRVGIVASVAGFFAGHGGWIVETSQHAEPEGEDGSPGRYFMRVEVKAASLPFHLAELRERFAPLAAELEMAWKITDSAVKKRVVLLVSKQEHCLYDLLARWKSKELDIEIPCVISNHADFRGFVEWHDIPFHHVPVMADNKVAAYAEVQRIFEEVRGDTMVLARYMQILSSEMCQALSGRAINIHHSFLPSFKGARPYHQAHARGVKIIGATAHYVTSDLDEGPIIEQDIERVDHAMSAQQLTQVGSDVESLVLARAVRSHVEHRILLNGNRTIVFR